METHAPSLTKIITMVLFALSCVGLLLFLWLSFGGAIPFNPQGYHVRISFPNADQLATQADVRIAGVSVGKVIDKTLDPQGSGTIATIEMDNQFAPIHKDARAILRQKTILGETFVELTPGTPNSPAVPDGGLLGRGQVQNAVQLSQIFNAFDPNTRRAFQVWQQELAKALSGGNDQNLNNVLGNLPAFAADTTNILQVLDIQRAAVVRLVQNGGTVFAALSSNQNALRSLITSAETTFATTAANNNALVDTFHVFPTFLDESKATMARLKSFALDTDPLVKALEPVAHDLSPTLRAVRALSPDLKRLFVDLGPLVTVSKTGLPAVRNVLVGAKPLLGSVGTFLEQLNPILTWLGLHQQLISDFISQGGTALAAKTTFFGASGPNGGITCQGVPCGHYLRQFSPIGMAPVSSTRDPNTRGNTYPLPLWLGQIFNAGGRFPGDWALPSWDCNNTGGEHPTTGSVQACWVQPPLGRLIGQPQAFAHVVPASYPGK